MSDTDREARYLTALYPKVAHILISDEVVPDDVRAVLALADAEQAELREKLRAVEVLADYLDCDHPDTSYQNGKRVAARMIRDALRGERDE